jgi:hypothetical protein
MWLDDISEGYYTVVQQEKDEQGEQDLNLEEEAEDEPECTTTQNQL